MQYTTHIDWLTVTTDFDSINATFTEVLPTLMERLHYKALRSFLNTTDCAIEQSLDLSSYEMTASRFYPANYHYSDGLSVSVGYNENQGLKLQMSGKSFDKILGCDEEIYERIQASDWNIRRADLAIDFFQSGITIQRIWSKYIEPSFAGKKLRVAFFQGKKGDSIYIGSRQSNFMLRIYDKGGEQGRDIDWIRFELEIKKDGAKSLPANYKKFVQTGSAKMLKMARALPQEITEVLQKISQGEKPTTVHNPVIRSDADKYIATFIKPYLKKHLEASEDEIFEIYKMLKAYYE